MSDPEFDPLVLRERIAREAPPPLLDVRSAAEFAAGHVPGAVHAPFWALLWRAGRLPLPRDAQIVIYCGHGPRARLARWALRVRGFRRTVCLAGHMAGWRRAGLPESRTLP